MSEKISHLVRLDERSECSAAAQFCHRFNTAECGFRLTAFLFRAFRVPQVANPPRLFWLRRECDSSCLSCLDSHVWADPTDAAEGLGTSLARPEEIKVRPRVRYEPWLTTTLLGHRDSLQSDWFDKDALKSFPFHSDCQNLTFAVSSLYFKLIIIFKYLLMGFVYSFVQLFFYSMGILKLSK